MGFHDVRFPTDISYGSSGGPGFSTSIITTDSGAEERVARWSQARRMYDVAEAIKTSVELSELITFYMARVGCANSFRYKDWADYASTLDHITHAPESVPTTENDQVIGVGDGTNLVFQLVKNYTSGPSTHVRTITKPVAGTVKIAKNGVLQVGGYTVNYTTGVVTFAAAPAAGVVVTAGYEFDVHVRFGDELDQQLPVQLDAYESGSVKIPLIEITDDALSSDEFFMGGAVEVDLAANYNLDAVHRVYVFSASASGKVVFLPDTTDLPAGGPWYYIMNDPSSPNTFQIKSNGGTLITTVNAGAGVTMVLSIDAVGTKVWYAK
jgi:uncharacterized protein (TIGR02217 family)